MRLDSAVALITGGASGLGAACARMVREAGGKVALVDLDQTKGPALAAQLAPDAIFLRADVPDAGSVEAAVEAALARFGRLDVTINCAGIGTPHRILGKEGPMPLDIFERVIRVNLIGTFNVSRLAAAAMARNLPNQEGERGVLIHTASIAAFDGQIGQCAYSASKGGIVGMTLPMARDLARTGIRVVTIAPGIFDTPLLAGLGEETRASLAASVPFPPKLGRPEQFAALARHIIENSYLNAEVIRLDAALRMGPK